MQRYITTSLIVVLLGLVLLWAGCGGKEVVPVQTPDETLSPESSGESSVLVPEWFVSIPEDPDHLYATATGTSKSLQLALDNAKNAGRTDIASQIGTKVSGLFKRFREEIGAGEDAELMTMTTAVSKEVVSEVISGCRAAKQDVKKEGISYRAYVLMEMPIGQANAALMAKVKANNNMYTRFRASQGFKELESEVEKYEEEKEGK